MNGDFILTVKYPISDTGIYKRIKEDMLIKCPTPVLGPQLFRIKKPVENNDQLEITAYHITDDIMQRSVKPVQIANQTCSIALSQMVQNAKTDLGDFSFTSDIQDRRTFNMTETENIYSVLLDGKHSIIGTWEGELVRDNFSLTIKKNRGENRGVVITTHKNLKSYQRSKNSQNVITRIHARSTFKLEGSEHETTIKVTVDSPLINSYPYINEKEYENNNLKTVEDLEKWAQAKFTNEGIDKVSDSIKLEAYELDGQVVHLGDTVNLKSLKHNADIFKKAIAYEYDGLKEEYISLEFDDKPGFGGSGLSNGLSNVANTILGATYSAQEIALERAAKNADLAFEEQSNQLKKVVEDGIELIKAKTEEDKKKLSDEINRRFQEFNPSGFEEAKAKAEEALKKAGASSDLAVKAKMLSDQILGDVNTFKSDYQADLNGINLRITQTTANNGQMFSAFTSNINGRMAEMASKVEGKVNQADFQRVKETAQLYERILGGAESDVSRNVSRMVLSNQVFQTEVGKYVTDDNNLIVNSMTMDKHTLVNANRNGVNVSVNEGVFTVKANRLTGYNFSGFTLPIYVKKIYRGETYTLGFKYRIREKVDTNFTFVIKNHKLNKALLSADIAKPQDEAGVEWWEFQKTFTVQENFAFGEDTNYPFYIYIAKNGWIEFKEPILVRGSKTGPYKPSQFDDAYKMTEATRTQVTQLAGSYAIKNLNSAGDLINGINLGADGTTRFVSKLTHISGDTLIDNAVIKSAMIDKLKTANFEAGSVTTNILGAEAVTAEKVKFDTAFIQRLVSQQAFINELFAKQATITKIQSIDFTGNHIKGGRISSLNGKTTFDLQSGWIDMNTEAVGIRNRFDNKPLQFLIFGQGAINGVPGAYTQLMSNRNGVTGIEHTSAGIQIWNGRQGENIQTAITFYGKSMDFMPNSLGGGIIMNTENRTISNLDNIYFRGTSLVTILNLINKNFEGIAAHFEYNKLGAPGRYKVSV
nr:MAG TPA: tail protein [Caudoviricetes sp.]